MEAAGDEERRWTPEALGSLGRAFMECRVLLTAVELDLFTQAAVPLTAEQLAGQIGADLRALTILLDALAAMGLLLKEGGAYRTEPSAGPLLARSGAGSILPMIRHSADLWGRWSRLTEKVAPAWRPEKSMQAFIRAMHVIAAPLAPRIVSIVDPGAARRLLDIGGALGAYTVAFLRSAPAMHATLFDLPDVIDMARDEIGRAGMLDRVTLAAGDYNRDPLPAGHDLAFLSAIIHQNSSAQNGALFRKVFAALEPRGRVVVRDHLLSPDRTKPRVGALFAVNMLVGTAGGNAYTEAEVRDCLVEAGFERVRLIQPDTRMDGLVEAFKPR